MRRLGELQAMRHELRSHRRAEGTVNLAAADAAESGKLVIEAKAISKQFDGNAVVRDFSIRINRGNRIGLVGPNGAGKTTLLKMLTGTLQPDSGTVRLGVNLEIAALDQKRAFDASETLAHYLTDGRGDTLLVNGEERHVVSWMKEFLFKPQQARTPISELSGGERARLILARVLSRPANLLVLDEPTNDLDMETLDLLQEMVAGFAGTVILVSHDRDFLDRTVTSLIVPEREGSGGDGRWIEYAGGYTDMLAQRGSRKFMERAASKKTESGEGKPVAPADPPRQAARKLSYKQKFALETLPGRIESASASIAILEAKLADPGLYRRDAKAFGELSAALDKERILLAAMEEEWLELEMLREELEG
jgi:ATP-binding cassette subfamily F protein uup